MARQPKHPDVPKPTKKSKPDWFPTTEHTDGLATYKDWIRAIILRVSAFATDPENRATVFRNVIEGHFSPWHRDPDFDWRGVRSATPYETILHGAVLEQSSPGREIRALVDSELAGDAPTTHEATLIRRSRPIEDLDEKWRQHLFQRLRGRHFAAVDLSLDAKTLKRQFADWLKEAQKSQGIKPSRLDQGPITQETLQYWNRYRVLAAFDLMEWRKLTGSTYPDSAIAAWLWPDDPESPIDDYTNLPDRFRKVTKKLVRRVFDLRMVLRLDRTWAEERYRLK